ncbi:MAG: DUF2892 domain-containing protein [Betaproteobacteria bacterium HGW-Betaproteobacteria-2]|nr:MAG: DUF2892 domain-containing protein [Betaproteobacteria bacterium HGW-Betaproteobacteria-2]
MSSGKKRFSKGEINVGQLDRALRILAGLCLVAILFIEDSPWRLVGLLGLAYILTGLTRWCPIYNWMGINICSTKKT